MDIKQTLQEDPSHLRILLNDVMRADLDGADCQAVLDIIAEYVDFVAGGSDSQSRAASEQTRNRFAGVRAHLSQCPACQDMHEALAEVVRLEAEGALPDCEELYNKLVRSVGDKSEFSAEALTGIRSKNSVAQTEPPQTGSLFSDWRTWVLASAALVAGLLLGQIRSGITDANHLAEDASYDAHRDSIILTGEVEKLGLDRRDDGSWAKAYFMPSKPAAVVYVGDTDMLDMPEKDRLECWIQHGEEDDMYTAGTLRHIAEDTYQLVIDASLPIQAGTKLVIMAEPSHEALFTIALGE